MSRFTRRQAKKRKELDNAVVLSFLLETPEFKRNRERIQRLIAQVEGSNMSETEKMKYELALMYALAYKWGAPFLLNVPELFWREHGKLDLSNGIKDGQFFLGGDPPY